MLGFAVIALYSLVPFDIGTIMGSDKIRHALAYFCLSAAGFFGFPRKTHLWLFLGIIAFGAGMEWAQATFTSGRFAELGDIIANAIGVVSGWAIARNALAALRKAGQPRL